LGGLFGVACKGDCLEDLFYGTDYHSHLGTSRGGMVVCKENGFKRNIHDISNTPFRTKFEDDLHKLHGPMGLGVISDFEDQPLLIGSHHGVYAIATVGKIDNIDELSAEAMGRRSTHFAELKGNEVNPTELVASMINNAETMVDGLRKAQREIRGSCTVLILTDKELYAARDLYGRTPLAIGKKDGAWAVTMETCALPNLGFEHDRFLGPAEIVRITPDGVEQVSPPGDRLQICTFLWIYYGYPATTYEGINTEVVRNACGAALARRDDVEVDMAAGIPDSGIGHAIGYATAAGVPYRRPFVKYTPTWPRSFMPQDQSVRDLVARMKLIPVRELIAGKRLLFCEDSIVRGTQLRDIITRVFDCGAREIHMRPACPPLLYGCRFLNFSRSRSEMDLAARKAIAALEGDSGAHLNEYADPDSARYAAMVEWIRDHLGLSSLKYQRLEDMIEAVGLPRGRLCTFCWDGNDPTRE
jgi:amidophosphoribosyltransferase